MTKEYRGLPSLGTYPKKIIEFTTLPESEKIKFSKIRNEVVDELVRMELMDKAEMLKSLGITDLFNLTEGFKSQGENEVGTRGLVAQRGGKQILWFDFNMNAHLNQDDEHVLRHEMFHYISDYDSFVEGNTITVKHSGLHHVIESVGKDGEEKTDVRFYAWNEAMIDVCAIEAGGGTYYSDAYREFVAVSYYIAAKIFKLLDTDPNIVSLYKEVFQRENLPQNSKDVHLQLRKQALQSKLDFTRLIEYAYGAGSSKLLSQLGETGRDFDQMMFFLDVDVKGLSERDAAALFLCFSLWRHHPEFKYDFDLYCKEVHGVVINRENNSLFLSKPLNSFRLGRLEADQANVFG